MSDIKNKTAFASLLSISSLTKLADLLVSPKTTLPWLVSATGAPGWLLPLLVPVKESGSLLPQWYLRTSLVHKFSDRLRFWRIGMVIQGVGILCLLLTLFLYNKQLMGIVWVLLLITIAFGRSICSLMMKDIQAENIEKGRRGRLVGLASSISGALTIVSGLLLLWLGQGDQVESAKIMVGIGGLLFLVAIPLSAKLTAAYNDQHDGDSSAIRLLFEKLKHEPDLQNLVVSRTLLLHSALIIPFIVAASTSGEAFDLPVFMVLSALASLITSYVWGKVADKSAVLTLKIAAAVCATSSLVASLTLFADIAYLNFVSFFVLTVGHAGIRTGRKTYVLDITDRETRTTYVAIANSLVGVALLTLGGVYAIAVNVSQSATLLFMSMMLFAGLAHTFVLRPEK